MAPVATIDDVRERIMAELPLLACWFEPFPFDDLLPRIEPGRVAIPAEEPGVARRRHTVGIELPVRFRGLTLGRFVLIPSATTCGVSLSASARSRAIDLAAGVGVALAASWT